MARFTGSEYFPGGLGEFVATANEFLVFETGPTETVTLQWATYYDASDEAGISRLYGGIHPRMEDLPGRRIGSLIGRDAFARALTFFDGSAEAALAPQPLARRTPRSIRRPAARRRASDSRT